MKKIGWGHTAFTVAITTSYTISQVKCVSILTVDGGIKRLFHCFPVSLCSSFPVSFYSHDS